ncbi:flagellar filament capping protein FliD [Sporomusa sphaeroides]|uniref:Flagellar hook-associated protein 2 n=1 Tax=Sporomusa sphaeroides DSM 2875 TaxID=1337886 RepID=A0ABM9W9Z0_9FIRM|nr:flagellar filament capping protein FliD [Sporomusa sphaeroides]OLS54227.1 flagellar hook-associated protein 2 [Sporomusa sphaeroides DSM 2875]CVK21625.1 Flagellar hook-associated protein 2 [Sporomusa sphaeroides DSM 2875]
MAIRTYGLSGSGMDVDQMVKDLMKARRTSYDKVWQQKTQVEWKKKDFNTLYTLTQDFRNKVVFDFRKQSSLQPKAVSSTNDLVVSATANGDAANVTHSLVVKRLAEGVTWTSSGSITDTGNGKSKESLVKQFDGITAGSTLDFKINGKQIEVKVTEETSLNDVVSQINNAGAGVKANYDATLDRFFLYSDTTGAAAGIDFTGSSAAGLNFLGENLKLGSEIVTDPDKQSRSGKDALIVLDGVELTQSANEFQISGVSYNLKSVSATSGTDADGNPIYVSTQINVKADIEKTIANVKAFIEDYNTFLSVYNGELKEDKYRDFMPLTDAQRADLKDSEIAAWEAKAKSGMLRQDPILNQTVNSLRLSFVEPVKGLTGAYRSAVDIGIGTGAYIDSDGKFNAADSKNPGKLYVNEKTLREALEEDPDAVFKIFGTSADTAEDSGVANRLYSQLNTAMSQLKDEAGLPDAVDVQSNLAKRLTSYNDRLTSMMNSLAATEERYYNQFNAMEAALSRLSSQSSWLMQQFSQ